MKKNEKKRFDVKMPSGDGEMPGYIAMSHLDWQERKSKLPACFRHAEMKGVRSVKASLAV